jgi:hypothetical protein
MIKPITVKFDDGAKRQGEIWRKRIDDWNNNAANKIEETLKSPSEKLIDKILSWINYKNGLHPYKC